MVAHVQARHGVNERRSCTVLGVDRSSIRYVSDKPDQTPLMLRIGDLAATWTRYDYFRIIFCCARRTVREPQGSAERSRGGAEAQRLVANRERQPAALAVNEMWSMSFVSDALFDNRRLRALYRDHAGWKLADIVDQRGGA